MAESNVAVKDFTKEELREFLVDSGFMSDTEANELESKRIRIIDTLPKLEFIL